MYNTVEQILKYIYTNYIIKIIIFNISWISCKTFETHKNIDGTKYIVQYRINVSNQFLCADDKIR